MHSRREQFGDAITTLKRLGEHPRAVQLEPLRERVERLDHELNMITDPDEHYALSKLSREANALLSKAHERHEIAVNVARAAHARENTTHYTRASSALALRSTGATNSTARSLGTASTDRFRFSTRKCSPDLAIRFAG